MMSPSFNKNSSFKMNYFQLIKKSLVLTLIIIIVSFQAFKKFDKENNQSENKIESIIVEEIPITKIDIRQAPPVRPKVPIPSDDPEIPDDLTIEETELLFDEEYPEPPTPPTITKPALKKYDSDPEPIGGLAAIKRYLKYPDYARRAGIEGQVVIKALISEEGKVVKWKFLESLGFGGCDEAALTAMKKVKWKPAIRSLKPVQDWVTIPFKFRLVKRF